MQSQTYYGADSRIHGLLMEYLDRDKVDVHAACNYGGKGFKSASALALEKIPNLHLRPTRFGATIYDRSKKEILKDTFREGLPGVISLGTLPGYLKKNKIDIIHCTEKPRDAYYGYLLSRLSGAKCIIHLHVKAESWISPKVQWAMKKADALVGVSKFVAESISAMGYPPEKIHYVHNSIDLNHWNPDIDGSQVRKEFNIGENVPLLLITSRLFYWKGHTELLQALAILKADVPEFKLLIVGEDDPRAHPGRGSYSEELKCQARELGLMDHVIFTGFRSDIPQLLAACDLYVMPSFEEPFGMVYLEAMAMKKPVVALDNGGSREIVEHGVSGLLSRPKDIDCLADHLKTLIQDPLLRLQMGACGRNKVEDSFTPARICADMLEIYRHVVERRPVNQSGSMIMKGEL